MYFVTSRFISKWNCWSYCPVYVPKRKMSNHFENRTAYLRKTGRETRDTTSLGGNELGVISKVIDLYSDGVRLSATIWEPDKKVEKYGNSAKLPAILLCHGWGGIRDHLDSSYAPKFAAEGFICLTFDYRTWGDSDGVLMPNNGMPEKHDNMVPGKGSYNIDCTVLKKVVDPEWQLQDIKSCMTFLRSLKSVDQDKLGSSHKTEIVHIMIIEFCYEVLNIN